ncbi:uncharacterized protein METZ01_LOCUS117910 [marine metagenome]|uniref:NAD-dependent epimerase/dehydratase domain-containing protein n=1 Tax=marine metagenome TaxID=408172 RepID=A0A381XJW5_9ZZZZ
MKRIVITGAGGQIGSELVTSLRERYGQEAVLATDIRPLPDAVSNAGPTAILDVQDQAAVAQTIRSHDADTIFHLAAILSAVGEENPSKAYTINMGTLRSVLEVARQGDYSVFTPSSIAVFGPTSPKQNTPQNTIMRPTTMYGITKVAGELLCDYYYRKYGVDTRGVRYPGLISYGAPPGGGTTDWAVDIFIQAIQNHRYTCFLKKDTILPMMYMPDAIEASIQLMEADPNRLIHRNAFNVTAMHLDPQTLADEIKKHIPNFTIEYKIDQDRESIAQSWPRTIDDSVAKKEWDWSPKYNIKSMTAEMIAELSHSS